MKQLFVILYDQTIFLNCLSKVFIKNLFDLHKRSLHWAVMNVGSSRAVVGSSFIFQFVYAFSATLKQMR